MDVVAQSLKDELFLSIRNQLPEALTRQLGIELEDGRLYQVCWYIIVANKLIANERCALLLSVDPHVEERRIQLKKEQVTLAKAQEHLSKLIQDVHRDEESETTII